MTPRIVLPALLIALAVASVSAAKPKKIKCYECIAVGANDECDGDIMVKSDTHKPIECNTNSLYAWHNKVRDEPELTKIADIFKVGPSQKDVSQKGLDVPMACIKMNLRVNNQPVILRTCQTAKTEQVDACISIERIITSNYAQHAQVQNCSMCDTDSCNGSYGLSPMMLVTLVPLAGSLLMNLLYAIA